MPNPINFGDNGGQQGAAAAAEQAAAAKLRGDVEGNHWGDLGDDASGLQQAEQNANDPRPQVGGYAGGANAAANYYNGLATQAGYQQAPIVHTADADAIRAQRQATVGQQGDALAMQQAAALGNGPTAAPAVFGQGLQQSILGAGAASGGVRGGGGALGAAQVAGMRQAAAGGQQSAYDATALRAQELQQARGNYLGGGLGMGGQALTAQGQDFQQGYQQARLRQNQQQLNQQAALGYSNIANQYELGQLGADSGALAADMGQQEAAAASANQQRNALVGGAVGGLAGGAELYAEHSGKDGNS